PWHLMQCRLSNGWTSRANRGGGASSATADEPVTTSVQTISTTLNNIRIPTRSMDLQFDRRNRRIVEERFLVLFRSQLGVPHEGLADGPRAGERHMDDGTINERRRSVHPLRQDHAVGQPDHGTEREYINERRDAGDRHPEADRGFALNHFGGVRIL